MSTSAVIILFHFEHRLAINLNDWVGPNIDVDRRAIDLFNQYRRRDVNVHCAVGKEAGQAEVSLFSDGAINSLDPDSIAR